MPEQLRRPERLHASDFVRELLRLSIAFADPRFEACFQALVDHGIVEAEGGIQAAATLKKMAGDIILSQAACAELNAELARLFVENRCSPLEPPKLGREEFKKIIEETIAAFILRSGDLEVFDLEELPKVQFTSLKGSHLEVVDTTNETVDRYQNTLFLAAARRVMATQKKKSKRRACAEVAALFGVPGKSFDGAIKRVSRLFPKSGQGGAPPEF